MESISSQQRLLIAGCGPVRWLRSDHGVFGEHWERGSFGAHAALSPEGTRHGLLAGIPGPGEGRVSLSGLMDREACWLPEPDYTGDPELIPLPSDAQLPPVPRVPALEGLARAVGSWASVELGGTGTLAIRRGWSSERARSILHAMGQVGWRLSYLEDTLALPPGGRALSRDGLFLRLVDPEQGDLVLPVDAHVARALSGLRSLYKQLLEAAGPELSARFLEQEEDRQGWYVRSQIFLRVVAGLRAEREEIDLGGAQAPLFGRSPANAPQELEALHRLRVRVRFPPADTSDWLQKVEKPGFLRSRSGRIRVGGLGWSRPGLLLLDAGEDNSALIRGLESLGVSPEPLSLDALAPRLAPGVEFAALHPGFVPVQERTAPVLSGPEIVGPEVGLEPEEPQQAEQALPETPAESAPELPQRPFEPQVLELSTPHRRDSLRLSVEGAPIDVSLNPLGGGRGRYLIEGTELAHGALLRVDFEPQDAS